MIIMHATFSTEAETLEEPPFGGEPRAPTHNFYRGMAGLAFERPFNDE